MVFIGNKGLNRLRIHFILKTMQQKNMALILSSKLKSLCFLWQALIFFFSHFLHKLKHILFCLSKVLCTRIYHMVNKIRPMAMTMFLKNIYFLSQSCGTTVRFSYCISQVLLKYGNVTHEVWSQTGNQGNKWRRGEVFLGIDHDFQVCQSSCLGENQVHKSICHRSCGVIHAYSCCSTLDKRVR